MLKKIKVDLHPNEWELIRLIREKYRFGIIEVITRDGIPDRISKTTVYESVKLSTSDLTKE